jgi:polyamine oxidase
MGMFFVGLQTSAQDGEAPPASMSVADALYDDNSPLYEGLPDGKEGEVARLYANASCRVFDGWTGGSIDKVSFKWWGWESQTNGPDAHLVNGYGDIIEALAKGISKAGGKIELKKEVVAIELGGEGEDDGKTNKALQSISILRTNFM